METFLEWLYSRAVRHSLWWQWQCVTGEDHVKHFWLIKPKGCLMENFQEIFPLYIKRDMENDLFHHWDFPFFSHLWTDLREHKMLRAAATVLVLWLWKTFHLLKMAEKWKITGTFMAFWASATISACIPLDFFLSEIINKLLIFMSPTHLLFNFIACTYCIYIILLAYKHIELPCRNQNYFCKQGYK